MTRPLLIVAALGFISAMTCFAIAFSMGGLNFRDFENWDFGDGPPVSVGGPEITRTIAWPGGDELNFSIEADIEYLQGPANTIVVTGPKGAVDRLVLRGDRLRYGERIRPRPRLRVVMTAPDVEEFGLYGSQRLKIAGYDHQSLQISVFGSAKAEAEGRADRLELNIAGSGDADLSKLKVADAEVSIAGSGDATVGPTDSAEIKIAGSGDVTLTTRPARLETRIAGSGKIVQEAPEPAAAPEPANVTT